HVHGATLDLELRDLLDHALIKTPPSHKSTDGNGDSLTAADAGRDNAKLRLAALHLERERQHDPRPRSPERVPERDRAAVDVDLLAVEPELLLDGEVLGREGLVDLDQVHAIERLADALQGLADRGRRADAHDLGRDADGRVAENARQDRE